MAAQATWEGHQRGSAGYKRILLALLCAGVATFAQLYSVQGVLPLMAQDLGIDAAQSSLAVSAATLGLAVAVIPWSLASDRYGRRRTMVVAVACATVLGVLMCFMPSFHMLVGVRFVEGMALGGIPSLAMTYLAEEVHPKHNALAAGSYISGTTLGGLSGRIIAAPVGDFLGWRVGTITVAVLAAVMAVLFVTLAPQQRGFKPQTVQVLGVGGLLERLRINLKDPALVALYMQGFLLMGGFVAMYNYIGFHLGEDPYNVPQSVISVLFLAYLAGTWSSSKAGGLVVKHGRRPVMLVSSVIMLAGLVVTLLPWLPAVVAGLVVFTTGFFGVHSVANGWVPVHATVGRAQASSLYTLFYYGGSAVFGYAVGIAFTAFGWGGAVLFIGVLVVVAMVFSVGFLPRHPLPEARLS